MAITNHERVGKAMEFLKRGLQPFVEREMKAQPPNGGSRKHGIPSATRRPICSEAQISPNGMSPPYSL